MVPSRWEWPARWLVQASQRSDGSRVCDAHWLKHVNSDVWAARTNYVVAHARNVNVSDAGTPLVAGIRLKPWRRIAALIYTRQIYVGKFKVRTFQVPLPVKASR